MSSKLCARHWGQSKTIRRRNIDIVLGCLLPHKKWLLIIVRWFFQRKEADGDDTIRLDLRVGDEPVIHCGSYRAARGFERYFQKSGPPKIMIK